MTMRFQREIELVNWRISTAFNRIFVTDKVWSREIDELWERKERKNTISFVFFFLSFLFFFLTSKSYPEDEYYYKRFPFLASMKFDILFGSFILRICFYFGLYIIRFFNLIKINSIIVCIFRFVIPKTFVISIS